MSAGRRAHYGDFYGDARTDGAAVVLGNCQAESLRVVLAGPDLPTVRMPPVHELTVSDLPFLDLLLRNARVVVTQPIRDNYRNLPVGTHQVAARLAGSTQLVVVPAIRHRALHPAHVVVRPASGPVEDPPVVVYHDLRTIAEALGERAVEPSVSTIVGIAAASTAELKRREKRHDAVPISDVFARPDFSLMRTMNHPGNPVWKQLALRVRARLSLAQTVTDPGRQLLSSVIAPREPSVIEAWALADEPDSFWHIGGSAVAADTVRDAHRRWYESRPDLLRLAAERHADALREFVLS